jgi:hypothetical protein
LQFLKQQLGCSSTIVHRKNPIKKNPSKKFPRKERKVKPEPRKESRLEEKSGRWARKLAQAKPRGAQGN